MTATYEKIATTTLGSAAGSTTFTSITGSYTDLVLVINLTGVSTGGYAAGVQFNSDTGSNYSVTNLYGNGTSAVSTRTSNANIAYIYGTDTGIANAVSTSITNFQNYSNSTTYKTFLTRHGQAGTGTMCNVGMWRSTSAITSIKIEIFTGTFSIGSTFTLYGIKAE
jgi:hypothetical protein